MSSTPTIQPLHDIPLAQSENIAENEPLQSEYAISQDDSTLLQEHTMVESEDMHEEKLDDPEGNTPGVMPLQSGTSPFQTSPFQQARQNGEAFTTDKRMYEEEQGMDMVIDPLRTPQPHVVNEGQELTVVVEDDENTSSDGGMLYSTLEDKRPHATSKRTSHLHLDLNTPSPPPWEVVDPPSGDPPSSDARKGGPDFYSTLESRKYHTLQSTTHSRPLIPKSSYYFGPPPSDSAFGTPPTGQIGVHHPREIIRIERDYTGGELIQFAPIYPLELEGRLTPTHFLESINAINELLISAHSLRHSFLDNMLAVFSLQLSRLFFTPHYEKEMHRLESLIEDLNIALYNPVGLNIMWPRDVAFLFLEIEYY